MIALRSFGDKGAVSVERIICNHCGRDLGPKQPLPHTLAFCNHCGVWINSEGKALPRRISEAIPKAMATTAKQRKRRAKNEELISAN